MFGCIDRFVAKIKLRFFSTASLIEAYDMIESSINRNPNILDDEKIVQAQDLIVNELKRRGDESLL